MIYPHTAVRFIDEEKGHGLVATQRIPCGTIVWTLDHLDRLITPDQMDAFDPRYRDILMTYSFRNNCGEYIFCWDNGRFINHSFNANCCLTPYNFEIAIRDIEEGEELTDDYGYLNIIEPFEASPEGSTRNLVYPDDLLRYAEVWDKQLAAAFPKLNQVEQPLHKFMEPEVINILQEIHQKKRAMLSIRSCYYDSKAHE